MAPASLLVGTVAAVGVLHTLVPDHWAPIVVIARQRRWSLMHTLRAAALAGFGHVTSTLLLGVVLWLLGATVAAHYGHVVNLVAAVALIAFGLWIAFTGWREVHAGAAHAHDHKDGRDHDRPADAPGQRTALLLILGSSPMVEGLPAFLAASAYGFSLLVVMAVVFAVSTIVTYVLMTGAAARGLAAISLGPLERYGEVFSGLVVAAVGIFALVTA